MSVFMNFLFVMALPELEYPHLEDSAMTSGFPGLIAQSVRIVCGRCCMANQPTGISQFGVVPKHTKSQYLHMYHEVGHCAMPWGCPGSPTDFPKPGSRLAGFETNRVT